MADHPFDGEFGLRSRNQHARIDTEHPPVETGLAGDVCERCAALAQFHELFEPLHDLGPELAFPVRDHLGARNTAGMREEKHRVEPPGPPDRLQPHRRVTQRLADRQAASSSPASRRDFSHFCSSTMSFSMSPSRITLMFWKF